MDRPQYFAAKTIKVNKQQQKNPPQFDLPLCGITEASWSKAFHSNKQYGLYQVGVHIADVSHFIRPNTALDKEAASRGTTVYLCDQVIFFL